jgi:hypothetical protein
MSKSRLWLMLALIPGLLWPLQALRADDGPMQKAGQKLDEWGNDAGRAIGKAAAKTGSALDKAARKTGEKFDEWGNKIHDKLAPSGGGGN